MQLGIRNNKWRYLYKPTPRNLRYFSHAPFARRAINAIKNPIKMLDWEITPLDGIDLNYSASWRTLPRARARTRRVLADFGVGVWGVNQKPEGTSAATHRPAGVRPVRIANELRKRGLTVSPAGSQTKCLAISVAPVGPCEPARLGV
jgi:hypothetical protein